MQATSEQAASQRAMTTAVRPGLYHVRLVGARGCYEPSEGIVLQFKRSYGYFTLPGPDRTCVAYAVGNPAGDGSVEVEVDPSLIGAPNAKPLQRRANPMPRQRRSDRFWSDVARMRNAGLPFSHLFGALHELERPLLATFSTLRKPGEPQPYLEVEVLAVVKMGRGK